MSVRPATEADAAAVAGIWNAVIEETLATFNSVPKTLDEVRATIRTAPVFVVGRAGVDGFATYGQFRGGVGYARTMEHTVHVAPAARGRGRGRALLAAVEAHAAARGAGVMIAGISGANPDGLRFHARLGYSPMAVLPEVGWKAGRWLDLHLMEKRLSSCGGAA